MIEALPPAAYLLAAAALIPILPLAARRAVCVLAPIVGLLALWGLPQGEAGHVSFLGLPLTLLRVDGLSGGFALVFLVIALAANVYGWHRTSRAEQAAGLLYAAGGVGAVLTGDLLTLVIAWEVMAVAAALLVFLGGSRAALRAGQRYLMVHMGSGGVLLLGVALIAGTGAPLTFGHLTDLGPGATLILFALCINAAVPPLHAWLPDAYPHASVSGSVFLSAFTTKAAVYCLLRGFAGSEALVWLGAGMAVYGVVFAMLENNLRRLLSYHIVSQVGYMVCAAGMGSALAVNASAAHAICHILYKGLLFMSVGALVYRTGSERLSDLGGLARDMPVTLALYMVGALAISGAPLFNGFVSKSIVLSAAAEDGRGAIVLLLSLASVGTVFSVGLKLPYFAWFGRPGEHTTQEAPPHMLIAMGALAALCILIGVAPGLLYAHLPVAGLVYHPYSLSHVFEVLLVMAFAGVAFAQMRARLQPHRALILDTDWFYRRGADWVVSGLAAPLATLAARWGARVAHSVARLSILSHNPPLAWQRAFGAAPATQAKTHDLSAELPWFDADRQRPPVASAVLLVLLAFGLLGVVFALSGR